ncbi:histidine phosphatase family protein [Enterococcus termitis]|uniref:phosphoglycerate mutase (2,3-diphosphoglycerate-dependent) n=1 Tax=Enterococcus termitis TaxID=332950 RepID=A0A1E5G778_9ENTE|nr:histidine phosphatase family protein [Enterococcus termitis]OEG08465.1 hypothetical protein BCR25_13745 [Enterococcus termitis]OJG98096.1 fructose-2,6-bisphosphatase [Enterococcus termitis]
MKKKIYLLRHGETTYNRKGIYQGILDSPLTEVGKQQAQTNGFLLKRKLIAVADQEIMFVSSPLERALQSSALIQKILNRNSLTLITDERLKEVNIGRWNGKNKEQIQQVHPTIDCDAFNWYFNSPDGESLFEVKERCNDFIRDLTEIEAEHVIIMAHGLFGRVFRGCLLNLSNEELLRLDVPQTGFFMIEKQHVLFITNQFDDF